jgi:cbb3-type cytochrome oxidase maturation protein
VTIILFLLGVSLMIGASGLGFFLWSLRSGQYDDLDGAANRILFDDDTTPRSSKGVPALKPPKVAS